MAWAVAEESSARIAHALQSVRYRLRLATMQPGPPFVVELEPSSWLLRIEEVVS